jgi:hypothetical protein
MSQIPQSQYRVYARECRAATPHAVYDPFEHVLMVKTSEWPTTVFEFHRLVWSEEAELLCLFDSYAFAFGYPSNSEWRGPSDIDGAYVLELLQLPGYIKTSRDPGVLKEAQRAFIHDRMSQRESSARALGSVITCEDVVHYIMGFVPVDLPKWVTFDGYDRYLERDQFLRFPDPREINTAETSPYVQGLLSLYQYLDDAAYKRQPDGSHVAFLKIPTTAKNKNNAI